MNLVQKSKTWIKWLVCLAVCCSSVDANDKRQVIAEAYTSYHSFHSIQVSSKVYAKEGESILLKEESGDLWVRLVLRDQSSRSAIQNRVHIRVWEDQNFPNLPAKWVMKFDKTIREGGGESDYQESSKTYSRESYVKLPGMLFDQTKPIHKVKMDISLSTKVKFGWSSRQSQTSRTFYMSQYPRFRNKRLITRAVQKLNTWAYARQQMFQSTLDLLKDFMDPTYKIKDGETPLQRMRRYQAELQKYMGTYYDEVDFKAYMSEFVTSYSRGIDESIDFPVSPGFFLNVQDKDFDLDRVMPAVAGMMLEYDDSVVNHRHFLDLVKLVGLDLDVLEKVFQLKSLSLEEMDRLSVFQVIDTRNGYIDRLRLLKKTVLKQQRHYQGLGEDLKRLLGWSTSQGAWTVLEQSPLYDLAGSDIFRKSRNPVVDRQVIDAVRGLYYALFFTISSEDYYSKIVSETVELGMGVFQMSPPEITFRMDQDIVFNGQEAVLIARVFNPSKYVSLENVSLLMEKNNLRRMLFYRGDNLQKISRVKPQEVKYVFFRFSAIGVGTDYPSMKVRYNKDFETTVRVDPIVIQRKDEFLAGAMERVEEFQAREVYSSYSSLKEKLRKFQDRLHELNWKQRMPQGK